MLGTPPAFHPVTPVRFVVTIFILASCSNTFEGDGLAGDDSGSGGNDMNQPTAGQECVTASDCAAGAAKCCDCPSYAAPKSDPQIQACAGVMCPPNDSCPANVEVACNAGLCELACVQMACSNSCSEGFALDANGCLTCDCAEVTSRTCGGDPDCVEAPADCCGCAKGGTDTSVPATELADHDAGLGCPANPACPGASTCDANEVPSCVQGACFLIPPVTNGCGRDDLPACASGSTCTINVGDPANPANAHRVGVCL